MHRVILGEGMNFFFFFEDWIISAINRNSEMVSDEFNNMLIISNVRKIKIIYFRNYNPSHS